MVKVVRLSPFFSDEMLGIWNSSIQGPASYRCPGSGCSLLGVQLDDELLLHGRDDLVTVRQAEDLGGQRVVVGLKPCRNRRDQLCAVTDDGLGARAGLEGENLARADLVRRDV